jgi:hypothetical protein
MDDFDENELNPLRTKTFAELGVERMSDIDYGDILFFVRDLLQEAGEDLSKQENVDEKCMGVSLRVAAMYVNMALNECFGTMTFKKGQ